VITEERIEQLAYEFVNDSDGTLGALQNALRNAAEESDRTARQECAETGSENDICNICNELLDHWKEQNKPHLDDDEKCCYVLAVRAVDEIRRLRAVLDGLPQEALDGGWTAKGISAYARGLECETERLRAEVDGLRAENWSLKCEVAGQLGERQALLQRTEEAEADAERYRWLRNDAKNTDVTQPIVVRGYDGPAGNYFNEPLWDDELDAAIDAARKGE
jgi:hypothetical protein